MNKITFAAHFFENLESSPFNINEYSLLKFGSDIVAKKFGYELAEKFYQKHLEVLLTNKVLVIPSPYSFVKNAATIMTEHFINKLNDLLVEGNGNHVEYITIQRKVSYINDYGFLSKDKRKGLLDNDEFFINKEFIKNKFLIFVDDVKITGTHENKIEEVLEQRKIKNSRAFLYFAQYLGDKAEIESELNFAKIKGIRDYIELMNEPNHHVIVRPLKFLLSKKNDEIEYFIQNISKDKLCDFYYKAIGEGYSALPCYQNNLNRIKEKMIN